MSLFRTAGNCIEMCLELSFILGVYFQMQQYFIVKKSVYFTVINKKKPTQMRISATIFSRLITILFRQDMRIRLDM
jgi:hypothetical protein